MSRLQRGLILVFALGLVASCAHVPHSPNPDTEIATFRSHYLAFHPEGQFNDKIKRGELVKGMTALEVLASWGVPHARRRDNTDETWAYHTKDGDSDDFTIYELDFNRQKLDRWLIARSTTAAGGVVPFATPTASASPLPGVSITGPFGGSGAVKKTR